jgi:hypothetical protein
MSHLDFEHTMLQRWLFLEENAALYKSDKGAKTLEPL